MIAQLPPKLQTIYQEDPLLHNAARYALSEGKTYTEMLEACVLLMFEQKEAVSHQLVERQRESHTQGVKLGMQCQTMRDRQANREGLSALAEQATGTRRVFDVPSYLRGKEHFFTKLKERSLPMTFDGCRRLVVNPNGNVLHPYRLSVYLNELIEHGMVKETELRNGLDTYEVQA